MNFKKYHVSKNLFDKDNATVKTLYIDSSLGTFHTSSNARTVIMSCEPNTTYTISKMLSARFSVAYSAQVPVSGDTANGAIDNHTGTNITITTDNNARYLSMFIYNSAYDTATFEDIENSVMVNEGSQPLPYEPYSSEVWHDIPYYIHNTSTDTITTLPAVLYPTGTTATVGLKGQASQQSGTTTVSSKSVTVSSLESGTNYALFPKADFPNAVVGDTINIVVSGTSYAQKVMKIDASYVYIENRTV